MRGPTPGDREARGEAGAGVRGPTPGDREARGLVVSGSQAALVVENRPARV